MLRGAPKRILTALAALTVTSSLTACGGLGWAGGSGNAVRVLMVNNPQMIDLQKLAPDFTKQTGIGVNFTVLPENDLRDKASQEFSSQAGQYDVATLSNFEIPFYSKNGWLTPMDRYIAKDPAFDQADMLKPIAQSLTGPDGKIYGEPFYGESSFLMYRKDVFAAKGLTMPAHPTWPQVAALAAKVDDAQPGHEGHLPARPARLGPGARAVDHGGEHLRRYLVRQGLERAGERPRVHRGHQLLRRPGPEARRGRCRAVRLHRVPDRPRTGQGRDVVRRDLRGRVARGQGSPVAGKIGYAPAPVVLTKNSGWLYAWSWAIEKASKNKDDAWKFVSWASSKGYENLVGRKLGWASVPAGKRTRRTRTRTT